MTHQVIPHNNLSGLPTGQSRMDTRPVSHGAKQGKQAAIHMVCAAPRAHPKNALQYENQIDRFSSGNGHEDMRIAKGELLGKYVHKNASTGAIYVSPHSRTHGETLVWSSLCGAPRSMRIGFAGQAISDFDAGNYTKKDALVTVMPSGYTMFTNTGPHILRAGDFFGIRAPSGAPGQHRFKTPSGTKIVLETFPINLTLEEFRRPIDAAVADLERTIAAVSEEDENILDDLGEDADVKKYGAQLRALFADEDGENVSVAAFKNALKRDVHQMCCMLDVHASACCDSKEVVITAKMHRLGWKFFYWVKKSFLSRTENEALADVAHFGALTAFGQYVNSFHINSKRDICGGQVVGTGIQGRATPAILGRNF